VEIYLIFSEHSNLLMKTWYR